MLSCIIKRISYNAFFELNPKSQIWQGKLREYSKSFKKDKIKNLTFERETTFCVSKTLSGRIHREFFRTISFIERKYSNLIVVFEKKKKKKKSKTWVKYSLTKIWVKYFPTDIFESCRQKNQEKNTLDEHRGTKEKKTLGEHTGIRLISLFRKPVEVSEKN